MANSRNAILRSVKKALQKGAVPKPFPEIDIKPEFQKLDQSLAQTFAEEFTKLGGRFVYCSNLDEAKEQLNGLLETRQWEQTYFRDPLIGELFQSDQGRLLQGDSLTNADAAIGFCECLIARTGSVLSSSFQKDGRELPIYAPYHIVVAYSNQIVFDTNDGLAKIEKKYNGQWPSMICLTAGPSRTADIEKTLVVGVHGPKEIFVFFIDSLPAAH